MIEPSAFLRKQTLISVVISMAISAAFFMMVFRSDNPVAVWAPDNLAFDFLPQSGAAGFMAALMPALQARAAIAKEHSYGAAPAITSIVIRALALTVIALILAGCVIVLLKASGITVFPRSTAFAIKVVYGALLGLIITPPALRAVLPKG